MVGTIKNEDFKNLLLSWPEKAMVHLYRYYYKRLARSSARRTRSLKVSEEIVQDTFLFVYRNHRRLGKDESLDIGPYLYGIVDKKSIDYYNLAAELNAKRHKYYIDNHQELEADDDELSISVETSVAIWQLIDTFPNKERECLVLKFLEGMTVDEIAQKLNVTGKAVERSITSAYKRFRKQGAFLITKK